MKTQTKNILLVTLIVVTAIADGFSSAIGNLLPVVGTILSALGNIGFEIIELLLVFGLIKTNKVKLK